MARIQLSDRRVDLVHRVVATSHEETQLTPREGALLAFLSDAGGQVVSRTTLLIEVFGYSPRARTRVVDTTMARLRQKIERDPSRPLHLLTEHGAGYRLALPGDATLDQVVVGRDHDIKAVEALLTEPGLVTLVGPIGIGKTALARVLAKRWGSSTIWVDLNNAVSQESLFVCILHHLGVRGTPEVAPMEAVAAVLRPRRAPLLVLDGADGAGARLSSQVVRLLNHVPELRVVVSSTHQPGEGQAHVVAPLTPQDAARLHTLRAPPGWDDRGLFQLCLRLEGNPLAVELAASQARVRGPAALLDKLQRGEVVAGVDGASPLVQAIGLSLSLLDEAIRSDAVVLSAFEGVFDVDLAEAMVGASGAGTLDLLASQSLLTSPEPGWFRWVDAVHAQLSRELDPQLRDRHALCVTHRARTHLHALLGPNTANDVRMLHRLLPDLTLVAHAGRGRTAEEAHLQLASLFNFEGYERGERAMLENHPSHPDLLELHCLQAARRLGLGDTQKRVGALQWVMEQGASPEIRWCARYQADVSSPDDLERSRSLLTEALNLGDPVLEVLARLRVCYAAGYGFDASGPTEGLRAVHLADALGRPSALTVKARDAAGFAEWMMGHPDRAAHLLGEAAADAEGLGWKVQQVRSRTHEALALLSLGEVKAAVSLAEAIEGNARQVGGSMPWASAATELQRLNYIVARTAVSTTAATATLRRTWIV